MGYVLPEKGVGASERAHSWLREFAAGTTMPPLIVVKHHCTETVVKHSVVTGSKKRVSYKSYTGLARRNKRIKMYRNDKDEGDSVAEWLGRRT